GLKRYGQVRAVLLMFRSYFAGLLSDRSKRLQREPRAGRGGSVPIDASRPPMIRQGRGSSMKTPITALALLGALAACPAWAQTGAPAATGPQPKSPFFSPVPAEATQVPGTVGAGRVFPNSSTLPEPTPADELKAPTMELPNDPIEPWLLKKENGPFMV